MTPVKFEVPLSRVHIMLNFSTYCT